MAAESFYLYACTVYDPSRDNKPQTWNVQLVCRGLLGVEMPLEADEDNAGVDKLPAVAFSQGAEAAPAWG